MLNVNYYIPKKDFKEYFIINTVRITVGSRNFVTFVLKLFVAKISSKDSKLHLGCDGIL